MFAAYIPPPPPHTHTHTHTVLSFIIFLPVTFTQSTEKCTPIECLNCDPYAPADCVVDNENRTISCTVDTAQSCYYSACDSCRGCALLLSVKLKEGWVFDSICSIVQHPRILIPKDCHLTGLNRLKLSEFPPPDGMICTCSGKNCSSVNPIVYTHPPSIKPNNTAMSSEIFKSVLMSSSSPLQSTPLFNGTATTCSIRSLQSCCIRAGFKREGGIWGFKPHPLFTNR